MSYGAYRPGEIYLCLIPHGTGHEMIKDRPAVVVSDAELNDRLGTVWVAMCSASYHADREGCVEVSGLERRSWALCDQLYTVDKSRLVQYICDVAPDELLEISRTIHHLLPNDGAVSEPLPITERPDIVRVETERDTYKAMYENLLGRVLRGGIEI